MYEKKLKVAVVGLGKMGLLHASILNMLPNAQLVALCDKNPLVLRISRRLFRRVEIVDDIEKLSSLGLDVIYVTTPIPSHFSVAKAIYEKKVARNLFVEKTLASNYGEAKNLCELARSSGGTNMVGYMKRYAVTFRKAKEILNQGSLGEVISFDAYAYSSDFMATMKRPGKPMSRGGVLNDLGSHIIDIALWFFGSFEVDLIEHESLVKEGSEDSVYFTVRKSGLDGRFGISWCMEGYRLPEAGMIIKCSKGNLEANDYSVKLSLDSGDSVIWYRHDLNDNVFFDLGAPEYFREDEEFVRSAAAHEDVEPSFYAASKVDHLIDQVKKGAMQIE